MRLIADYHTHTIYSHGKGTIRDNVEAALKKGLKEIAICDHGPGHFLYGVKREKLFKMREEIDQLNAEYRNKGIKILLGVEANLIGYDGTIDVDDEVIKILDLLLLGFHYGAIPKSIREYMLLNVANPLSKALSFMGKWIERKNTEAIIKALEKYPIDLITHPGDKARLDIRKVAEVASKKGVALEINAKHKELSVESLRMLLDTKVEFLINSDAHSPQEVGQVDKSIKRAMEAKIPIHRIRNLEEN
ncbi:MAG: PHP domain-containing protein [Tissierellia bacterium]|nr:PHP domain-containing protein [Tissierellia bacterium]